MEWISVKDRLPEMPSEKVKEGFVQMQVLVLHDDEIQFVWYQPDEKQFYDTHGLFGTEVYGVTHWMPLPEPPKEG